MLGYFAKRIVLGLVTIWFIASATFFGMHAVPGDPLAGDKAMTAQIRANLEAKYGLDQPLGTQYLIYLGNISQGDFGISYTQDCLLYTSPSPRDISGSRMPSSA